MGLASQSLYNHSPIFCCYAKKFESLFQGVRVESLQNLACTVKSGGKYYKLPADLYSCSWCVVTSGLTVMCLDGQVCALMAQGQFPHLKSLQLFRGASSLASLRIWLKSHGKMLSLLSIVRGNRRRKISPNWRLDVKQVNSVLWVARW